MPVTIEPRYFHVVAANCFHWCAFDAVALPGHEDALQKAILEDMKYNSDYEADNSLRLYEELHEEGETVEEYRERVIRECEYGIAKFEEYTLDEDGCLENTSLAGALYGETEADAAKALPLNGEPFAFKVWRSGSNG